MLDVHGCAQRGLELPAIRLEDRRALVREEISVFRIYYGGNTSGMGVLHGQVDELGRQHSLVVILEHHRGPVVDRRNRRIDERDDFVAPNVGVFLFIEAHDLLGPGDDASLGGGSPPDGHDGAQVRAELAQHLLHHLPLGVVTHGAHEIALGTDSRDVLRDVRRAAQGQLLVADPHDGDRGFGGDAVDVAAHVHVEHRVADYGYALPGSIGQQLD